jgi:hypothetical protein
MEVDGKIPPGVISSGKIRYILLSPVPLFVDITFVYAVSCAKHAAWMIQVMNSEVLMIIIIFLFARMICFQLAIGM